MRWLGCGICAAVFAVSVGAAHAAPPAKPAPKPKPPVAQPELPTDIETAESLYAKLDYDRANEVAEKLIKTKGLTHDQLVRAYRILAVTHAVLDKEDAARDAFLQLLVLDPEYNVDSNLGPKVSTPFMEARGHFRALPTKPGMEVSATVRSDGGSLRVVTRDPTHLAKKVSVGFRWVSSADYTVSQISVGEGTVEIPAAPAGRTRLDYYAQALDERDSAVFESGSPQVPKTAFVDAAPAKPIASKGDRPQEKGGSIFGSPFFWIFAGAAVVGGGAAAFFVLRPDDPPTSATLSPVIRCGPELCK